MVRATTAVPFALDRIREQALAELCSRLAVKAAVAATVKSHLAFMGLYRKEIKVSSRTACT